MKSLTITHEFKNSNKNIEKEKIKWFIDRLIDKYSVSAVEISINELNKKIKEEAI